MRRAESDARSLRRSGSRSRAYAEGLDGPERELANDRELMAAGILPGDPSLYPSSLDDAARTDRRPDAPQRVDRPGADQPGRLSVATLRAHGIEAPLPGGFEGRSSSGRPVGDEVPYPVAHFATFALPTDVGDFGGGAVNLMGVNDIFAVLFEYGPESLGRRLFARQGMPRSLTTDRLPPLRPPPGAGRPVGDPVVLHRGRPALHPLRRPRAATPGGPRWSRGSTPSSATCRSAPTGPAARPGRSPRRTGCPVELIGLYLVACTLLVAAGAAKAVRPDRHRPGPGRAGRRCRWPRIRRLRPGRRGGRGGARAWPPWSCPARVGRPGGRCRTPASPCSWPAPGAGAAPSPAAAASARPDTPATVLHVVVNAGPGRGRRGGGRGRRRPAPSSPSSPASPATDVPLVAVSALCAWLAYLAISVLAELQAARRLTGVDSGPSRDPPGGPDLADDDHPGRAGVELPRVAGSRAGASSTGRPTPAARWPSGPGSTWCSSRGPPTAWSAPAATATAGAARPAVPASPSSAARSTAATTTARPTR